jgi:hypothetical protein
MTILYDYKKIFRVANNRTSRIITIFDMLAFKRHVRSTKDPRYLVSNKDFSGNGFMLNPQDLLRYRSCYTDKEICQYIALAGLRSYAEYTMSGDISLPAIKSPIDINKLKANRLLRIEGNKVHFIFEEVLKEK